MAGIIDWRGRGHKARASSLDIAPWDTVERVPERRGTSRDEVLLDLVGEVYALLDLEAFQPGLLQALARAVTVDWASLNSLTPEPGHAFGMSVPPVPPEVYDVFAEFAHEHPIVVHMQRTGDGQPLRISDVIDRKTFRTTRLYRDAYALIGLEHQVAFTLPAPAGHVVGVALSRRDEDFTDAECALLRRARPHLIQAYLNALEHTALKRRLDEAPALPPADLAAYGLTPREVQVVRRVASGQRNRDVADQLGISDRTVQKHLEHAYRKLGVRSRSGAARIAWRQETS